MKRATAFLVLALIPMLAGCADTRDASRPAEFTSQAEAQKRCPHEKVVWVDALTGTYHEPGSALYGRALGNGTYVCRPEAVASPYMFPGHQLND